MHSFLPKLNEPLQCNARLVRITNAIEVKESFKTIAMEEVFTETNTNNEYMSSVLIYFQDVKPFFCLNGYHVMFVNQHLIVDQLC